MPFVDALRGVLGLSPIASTSPQSFAADAWPAFDDGNTRTPSMIDTSGKRHR